MNIDNRNNDSSQKNGSRQDVLRKLAPYLTLGWQLGITFGLFAFIGWWLDQKAGGGSTWIIICSSLGFIIGMYNFFKTVLKKDKRKKG